MSRDSSKCRKVRKKLVFVKLFILCFPSDFVVLQGILDDKTSICERNRGSSGLLEEISEKK